MKRHRFRLFLIAATCLASLWLWHQQSQLNTREVQLNSRITEARARLDIIRADPAAPDTPRDGKKAPAGPEAPEPAGKPLEVPEFEGLVGEINQMETSLPPGGPREHMRVKITALFSRLAATPAEELKAIMERLPSIQFSTDGREQVTSAIMQLLAKSDPPAAAAYALENKARPGTLETAVRSWSKMDASAASKWLDAAEKGGKLPSHVSAEQLRLIVLPALIAADPAGAAVDRMASLPSANLGDLIAETTRLLTTPAQRQAFLGKLAAVPGLPPDTVGRFLGQVGREASPKEAVELLVETGASLPADQFNRFAAAAATARIDAGTPAQAEWLLKNLRGTDRKPAISQLMQAWTQADFNAAGNWLRNQPPSADHDAAVADFASQVAGKEPPSAVDWAMTITDPARRTAVLGELYRDWTAKAPEQAAAYFQEKGLSSVGAELQ
ncbi:MAG: hypothetical protein JWM59_4992 [Verrucomicrobiales bacterium]|nr:hypothetical protein [Verrucomicrobiales bacterium]